MDELQTTTQLIPKIFCFSIFNIHDTFNWLKILFSKEKHTDKCI